MESLITDAGFWSIVPPLVAIVLALITKEVIFALLMGVMSGALIYSSLAGLGPLGVFTVTVETMISEFSDSEHDSLIIFLALIGALLVMITKAGGSRAYGIWAQKKIKSRSSAGFLTAILGLLTFIDDYFAALSVGTVMRPVTDRFRISRAKLAYLIDATAAPVCIIAPISSWSASVISYYPTSAGVSGMQAFLSAIPMNLYAILTIFMVLWIAVRKKGDYGPMAIDQIKAEQNGVTDTIISSNADELDKLGVSDKGRVFDLIIPILCLVFFSIGAMLWYGGYWDGEGKTLFGAFGDTDAGFALALGSFGALIVAFFTFVPRKVISFKDFFASIGTGIGAMIPAMIILTLAWTIAGVCRDLLQTGTYVANLVEASNMPVALIPVIMFVTACLLSFATGTSWGTFGILIPIAITICNDVAPYLSVITLSAVLAGAVFGDHCSPISDTTVLASTGASCDILDHIETQMPYAVTVAAVCAIGYLISGFIAPYGFGMTVSIILPLSLALLIITLLVLPKLWKPKTAAAK